MNQHIRYILGKVLCSLGVHEWQAVEIRTFEDIIEEVYILVEHDRLCGKKFRNSVCFRCGKEDFEIDRKRNILLKRRQAVIDKEEREVLRAEAFREEMLRNQTMHDL